MLSAGFAPHLGAFGKRPCFVPSVPRAEQAEDDMVAEKA